MARRLQTFAKTARDVRFRLPLRSPISAVEMDSRTLRRVAAMMSAKINHAESMIIREVLWALREAGVQ